MLWPKTCQFAFGAEWNMANKCQRRMKRMKNNEKIIIGSWKSTKYVL